MLSAGGIIIPADRSGVLERQLQELCADVGFPDREEFKYSPGQELWMRDNLAHPQREEFFLASIELASQHDPTVIVAMEDTDYKRATDVETPELDVSVLLLERINNVAEQADDDVIVISDRPGGGRGDEEAFLSETLGVLLEGTEFVRFDRVPINLLTTSSRHVRCLQLADLVTSSTTAFVSGEDTYSPNLFAAILPFVYRMYDCHGGRGVKIHPDYRYANLYHWLLGDTHAVRYPTGLPYPLISRPYAGGPDTP